MTSSAFCSRSSSTNFGASCTEIKPKDGEIRTDIVPPKHDADRVLGGVELGDDVDGPVERGIDERGVEPVGADTVETSLSSSAGIESSDSAPVETAAVVSVLVVSVAVWGTDVDVTGKLEEVGTDSTTVVRVVTDPGDPTSTPAGARFTLSANATPAISRLAATGAVRSALRRCRSTDARA